MKHLTGKILLALALWGVIPEAFAQSDAYTVSASTTNGFAPLTVQFTAPNTVSGPGYYPANSYNWYFGDGSQAYFSGYTGNITSHTYTNAGTYYPYVVLYDFTSTQSYQATDYSPPITTFPYSLTWFKVAGGGGTSTGGVYTVSDTIGQQDAGGSIGGGSYSVTLGFWSVLGQGAPAIIPTLPVITSQPQSQIVTIGNSVSFNVSVSGTPPFFYQWQKNGVNLFDGGNISGSSTLNLVLSTTSTNDAGSYGVIVYNAYGNVVDSSIANLTFVLPGYYCTDLGSLGGNGTYATAINNGGQVVGYSFVTGNASYHAFLYSGGTMTDLGTFGGNDSVAYGINNSGQVVGYAATSGNTTDNPFLYSGGSLSDLLSDDGSCSAYGINDNGQIVGNCDWYDYYIFSSTYLGDFGYLYSGGTFTDLGSLGSTYSIAQGINNNGLIVGYSDLSSGYYHAFLYSGGTMNDLGTLGGIDSIAQRINNNGLIAGYSETSSGYYHAFLYSGGTLNDLGTLGGTYSYAEGLNNSGQVVGQAQISNGTTHAFLYSGGTMFDLNTLVDTNTLGAELYVADGINDSGEIVATGNNGHSYLLTPSLPASYVTGPFPPNVQVAAGAHGRFTFNWKPVNTYPAVSYQMQYTASLLPPNWIDLGNAITNGNTSFTNLIGSNPQAFYRLALFPASAEIFQDDFDPTIGGGIGISYDGGDIVNPTVGVVSGVGVAGWPALQIQSTFNGLDGYGYVAGQWQNLNVSGNTDPNLSDYYLSFDACVTGDTAHQSGGGFALQIQEGAGANFSTTFPQGQLQTYQPYQDGSDLLVPQSGVWKHFTINLGGPQFQSPNGTNINFNVTGASWQVIFQLNSLDWGTEPQTNSTLIIDNLTLSVLPTP